MKKISKILKDIVYISMVLFIAVAILKNKYDMAIFWVIMFYGSIIVEILCRNNTNEDNIKINVEVDVDKAIEKIDKLSKNMDKIIKKGEKNENRSKNK